MRKHGVEQFRLEVVFTTPDEADAFWAERTIITQHRENGTELYNLTDGGDGISGYVMPPEVRARIGETRRRNYLLNPMPQEIRNRIAEGVRRLPPQSAESNAKKGAATRARYAAMTPEERKRGPQTEEHKAKVNAKRQPITPENRAKMVEGRRQNQKPMSEEAKEKIRQAALRRPPPSAESRAKMSASRMGKKRGPYKKKEVA